MDNYFHFEKKETDFPFYNDKPQRVSGQKWFIILLFPFLGFFILTTVYFPFLSVYGNELASGIILPLFSLFGLMLTVGKNWQLLFKSFGWKELILVIGYVIGAVIIAGMIGGAIELLGVGLTDNPMTTKATDPDAFTVYSQLRFQEIFQLFGEEFLAILPFLAILHLTTTAFRFGRKTGIITAWVCSSIIFGLLHLPTYDWNFIQCIFVIGGSRMLLTFPYIQTKNLWLSYFVHYFYDMLVFTVAFLS